MTYQVTDDQIAHLEKRLEAMQDEIRVILIALRSLKSSPDDTEAKPVMPAGDHLQAPDISERWAAFFGSEHPGRKLPTNTRLDGGVFSVTVPRDDLEWFTAKREDLEVTFNRRIPMPVTLLFVYDPAAPDPEASESTETPEPEDTEVAEGAGKVITGLDGKLYSTEPPPPNRRKAKAKAVKVWLKEEIKERLLTRERIPVVNVTNVSAEKNKFFVDVSALYGERMAEVGGVFKYQNGNVRVYFLDCAAWQEEQPDAGESRESNPALFLTAPESEDAPS